VIVSAISSESRLVFVVSCPMASPFVSGRTKLNQREKDLDRWLKHLVEIARGAKLLKLSKQEVYKYLSQMLDS
jgi:hypothetical protein